MPTLLTRARRIGSQWLQAHRLPVPTSYLRGSTVTVITLLLAQAPLAWASQDPDTVRSASVGDIEVETLATLEFPWAIAILPGNRMLITEKPGRLRIWEAGELSDPVKGVPEVVYRGAGDQGGLLDVVLDPDFRNNQVIYLSYVEAADQQPSSTHTLNDARFSTYVDTSDDIVRGGAVARARLDGNRLRDVKVIWRQEPKTLGRGISVTA